LEYGGIANETVKQRRSKAMDMRFYWIRDRIKQGQFTVLWRKGSLNLADYFTKHHSPKHHQLMRPRYLHIPTNTRTTPTSLPSSSALQVIGTVLHTVVASEGVLNTLGTKCPGTQILTTSAPAQRTNCQTDSSMYSYEYSKTMQTYINEGIIEPDQPNGEGYYVSFSTVNAPAA